MTDFTLEYENAFSAGFESNAVIETPFNTNGVWTYCLETYDLSFNGAPITREQFMGFFNDDGSVMTNPLTTIRQFMIAQLRDQLNSEAIKNLIKDDYNTNNNTNTTIANVIYNVDLTQFAQDLDDRVSVTESNFQPGKQLRFIFRFTNEASDYTATIGVSYEMAAETA